MSLPPRISNLIHDRLSFDIDRAVFFNLRASEKTKHVWWQTRGKKSYRGDNLSSGAREAHKKFFSHPLSAHSGQRSILFIYTGSRTLGLASLAKTTPAMMEEKRTPMML